jgi:hypothetical protein
MPTDGHWESIREAEDDATRQARQDRLRQLIRNAMETAPQQSSTAQPRAPTPPSLPDLVSLSPSPTTHESEVDLILAVSYERTHTRQPLETRYLVLWAGYSIHDTTWEPLSNLLHEWEAVLEAHAFFGLPPPEYPHPDA